jgi:type 1 glutamine amidotransferase
MRSKLALLVAIALLPVAMPAQSCEPFRVLVFWKTAGFVHASQIVNGRALIHALGAANGFGVDDTNDAAMMTQANLAQYAAVVFLCTSGDVLDATQQAAFEAWSVAGGGFVGVHSAADTEYAWPYYGALLGAWFLSHPPIQTATLSVTGPPHPSTAGLPATFAHTDEWYDFQTNPSSNPLIQVLLTVDESTYAGGVMGSPHPIAWCQDHPGFGRSWYTALGHTDPTYAAPFFQGHLLGGILWAAASPRSRVVCGGAPYGAASGSPPLALAGIVTSPSAGALRLSGGTPGAAGLLGISRCAAATTAGGVSVLIELAPAGFWGFLPVAFDAAGQWQIAVPFTLQAPGSLGGAVFFQGAQIGASVGVSNGFQINLCP